VAVAQRGGTGGQQTAHRIAAQPAAGGGTGTAGGPLGQHAKDCAQQRQRREADQRVAVRHAVQPGGQRGGRAPGLAEAGRG
jgi:hypothetical protein